MAFYTYILQCRDGTFYIGHTEDMEVRFAQHQRGSFPSCFTYTRRPVALRWCEMFGTRDEAIAAERRIKGWSRAKKEALIASDWERLSLLARNRQDRPRPSTSSGLTASVKRAPVPTDVRPEPVEGRPTECKDV
jgi:putative endonuclease